MERNLQEINRAKNMVWSAAGDYSFEPVFLGFRPDGSADAYLNLIHGLAHKWFDWNVIAGVFASFCGKNQELYEGLLWIGLEHAIYEKEHAGRPVLEDLRREYAWDNLRRDYSFLHQETVDLLYSGYFKEIVGRESGLSDYNEKLLHAFLFDGDVTTEQVVDQTRRLLREYFSWQEPAAIHKKGAYLLKKLYPVFHSFGKIHGGFVKMDSPGTGEENAGWIAGQMKKQKHFLLQISQAASQEEDRQYIELCFGESLYQKRELEKMEETLCTGNHKGMHLYFTRGRAADSGSRFSESTISDKVFESTISNKVFGGAISDKMLAETAKFRQEAALQYQKNLSWYRKNRSMYENSISRLSQRMESLMEMLKPELDPLAYAGKLNAGKVWKGLYLNDNRIFTRQTEELSSGFSVDLMLDASSSRKGRQESIACQGYILAESLTRCRIPVQVYSFLSIRRYTVMQLYRSYEETDKNKEIFRYTAVGSNRDGLALRGASWLMENASHEVKSEYDKRLLIMLTDASPNDEFCAAEGSHFKNREYVDTVGIQDTAHEVHALKCQGVRVLGIFMGIDQDVKAAKEIFGKDFVRIKDISQFADAVGNILQTIIETEIE